MSFQDVGKSKRFPTTSAVAAAAVPTNNHHNHNSTVKSHLSFGASSTNSNNRAALSPPSSAPSSGGGGGGLGSTSDTSQQLSDGILQYQRHVGILERIVQQVGTKADGPELESQFKLQMEVLQQLSYRLESLFRDEEQSFEQMPRPEAARRRATYVKLSRDYQRVQAQAKNYILEERSRRQRSQRQQAAATAAATATNASSAAAAAAAANSTSVFSNNSNTSNNVDPDFQIQVQLQLQQDKLAEEIMREREEEIRNINKGMHQVNEIYKDLAHIVGEQQTAIDQIENDMQDARSNAESGLKHVEKANAKFSVSGPASQCIIS